ncbi:T9SS type A sorting domain-containing protein [Arcicella rigui]|uniref:T9SS type A sorting domain-containing protein n=1 Tax=Arcicella rigui TaxID=797020 RepID=A0ABU5QEW3_9BACT|nr:T9SS type A sorting domain-containing protein [Arcicella rigui]MEA5141408.1 T9SS type A sorting domain-containing protein [Arcicella rigui]
MEKYSFSRKLLRAYIYVIAFMLGYLHPNHGFGTKNLSRITLSNSFTSTFNINIGPNIVYAEYFIDDDPGFGKGISIPITAGSSIEHTFSVTMPSTLSNGLHLITVRYKDASGNWSISSPRSFIKDSIISTSTSPNISFAEYFIDDDPGFGKGTAITLAAKSSNFEHTFSVLLPANLSDGIHVVTVRYKDDLGNWSISSPRSFLKESLIGTSPLPNLVYAEYFIDDEPGFGKGSSITITANSSIEHSVTIPLPSTLTDGLHTITVRYKDALGNWSISSPRSFLKESLIGTSSLPNLVYAEYFIDDDPGFGKGTAVQITANSTIEHNLTINIPSTLSEGLHLITVRYKDALGNWSISSARAFIKESPTLGMPLPELVYAEYFIDNDPGIGKGKAISFKVGQTIQNLLFDINLNNLGLTNGQHFLQLRVKDVNNAWSVVGTKTFVLSNELVRIALNNIVACSTGSIQIPYLVEGVFDANNQFKVELSDEKGEFPTSPKVLGFVTSKVNGQILISISDKSWLDKYKIRIVSTNPVRESDPVNLISKPLSPSITTTNTVICQGVSTILTANACENGIITWTGGLSGNTITIKPTKTTSYKALCTVNSCKSDSSIAVTITVTPKPATPVAQSNNTNVCLGTSAVLSATGCAGTVTWTGNLTGSSVTVTPSKTSTYKALCTVNGCKSDSSTVVTITVTPKPTTPVAKSNNSSICQGTSATLTSTGCTGTVTWTGNLTGSSVTVTPSKTSTYKALCTVNGCKSDSSIAVTITVTPKPATPVAKANNASVCLGISTTLSATGCTGTVSWTGNLTGSSVTVTPSKTSTYKALCTVNGCKSDSSTAVTITVTPKPTTPTAKSNNSSVCLGTSAVLTATGCTGTLTWTGNLTGSSVTVTPNKTTSYKALCTVNGCKSDSSTAVTITVTPKPATPVAKSNNSSLCLGTSTTLSATGCTGTVSWTGNLTGSSVTVTPSKTASYKALCTVNGCKSDSSTAVTITVTPKPTTPTAKSNNSSVCLGTSAILSATGCAGTVTWTGGLTGSSVTVTPTKTTSYKALCTVNGCKSDSSTAVTITVTPKPVTPVAKSNNSSVCLGDVAVLSATGCAGTVTWTGNLTGSAVAVTPSKTASYKALCTVNGCKSDSSTAVTITVTPKPTTPIAKSNNASVCLGTSAVLTATGCAGTLTWTGNLTGSSVTVTPTKTTSYKALCTINGCKSDSSTAVTITINPKPATPVAKANNASVCLGTSAVLTATGCAGTLTWTGNLTGSSVTVTPSKTTSYKALCTVNGCKSDSSTAVTITVTPKPTTPVAKSNNSSVCLGTSAVLTATGCAGTVNWTGNLTGSSVTVTPTKTSTYKALCTVNGCKSDSSSAVTITVTPKPTTPVAKSNNSSLCLGTSAVLSATGCAGTVTWTGNLTGSSVTVTPSKTSSYKALCTVNGCKSDSSTTVTITVTPKPATPVAQTNNTNVCLGTSTVLSATGCAGTVTWTGNLTGSSVTVTPNKTTSYKALCTVNGCKSDSSTAVTISVTPKPTTPVAKSNNASVCLGNVAILSATGCAGTLTWTGNLTGTSVTVTPSKTTSYKALCTVNGCKSDSSTAVTITVTPKPATPVAQSNNSSICQGTSAVLTATGCTGTLTWTGNLTGSSVTVTPNKTTSYKALCSVNGCKSDSSTAVTITVTTKPATPTAKSNNSSLCLGTSAVLSATGCAGTVTWTGNLTGSSVTVTPNKTTSYKALCTVNGCKSDSSTAVTITVNPKPTTPTAKSNNSSLCLGTSAVLSATGCTGTLTWTGNLTGSSITVTPSKTTSYKALCTVNGCKSDSSTAVTITVTPKPTTIVAQSNNASVCLGTSAVLSATGCAGTVTWTGNLTGSSVTVTPNKTTSYKALCTVNGCKSDSSTAVIITVSPKPTTPIAQSNNASVCLGTSAILSATGCAGTVTWTSNLTGSSVTVTPTKTSSYKALCMVNGCKSDSSLATTVNVLAKPNAPTITSKSTTVSSVVKQWEKTLKAKATDKIRTMIATSDGGFLLGGETRTTSDGIINDDFWLIKIDVNGNKVWEKAFGGNGTDNLVSILTTNDGGYVLAGNSDSNVGRDKSEPSRDGGSYNAYIADYWIIKINGNGNKIWDKTFGGVGQDFFSSIIATTDGGFLLGGNSFSNKGADKSEASRGGSDYWMVKINSSGIKIWDKTFGGSDDDYFASVVNTTDGGFLLGGTTSSGLSGDKSEASKGVSDYWIVRINSNGNKVWDKTFGGNTVDQLYSVLNTNDGGYLLGGYSISDISGDKSETKGLYDYWIIKINASGTKVWDKTFGGDNVDLFKSMNATIDNGYLLGGYSGSAINGNKSDVLKGYVDYWIVKIDNNGTKIWDKTLGGDGSDDLTNIVMSNDGSFLLGGYSESGISGDKTEPSVQGQADYWIVKIKENKTTTTTLTATGCNGTVTWSNGATGNSITVSPSTATTYTATCMVNGCISSASNPITVSVTVTKPTTPIITVSNATICPGTNATLTASACTGGTLTWTGGLTGNSISVSPTATKTYKVVCSQNGISSDSSAAVTVTVNPKPIQPKITVSNATICAGGSAVLSATACSGGTLTWTGGLTGTSITVSPTATKSYKAICAINGCKSDSSLATTVTVLAKPNAPTITSKSTTASSVVKQWEKTYGGNWYDYLSCIVPTKDGGYLLGGNSSSNIISGDKSEDIVGGWIVKVNADGNKIWNKVYEGMESDMSSIVTTSDGGFLIGGTSSANIGTGRDYRIIKIDANGKNIWNKTFGGTKDDYLVKIIRTSDGGFLIGGTSQSGVNGYNDYLIVKVDVNGNKQWAKFFGGSSTSTNILSNIVQTSDGGYLLAGDSNSNISGDKSENSKGLYTSDYWIIKIDVNGKKIWDKTFGGNNSEKSPDVILTPDGGFLLGGSSRSSISGDKSENYRGDIGYDDFWIIKLDSKGTKIWDRTFGGDKNDELMKIMVTPDGGFLLGGSSFSGISIDKSEQTQGHWLIKINANGQKVWDKTFEGIGLGGSKYDLLLTPDGEYIFGSSSNSSNYGGQVMDYWIIKIKENKTTTTTLTATGCNGTVTWSNGATGNSITVSPNTATTYTATCTVNGCVSSASNAIKVSPDAIIPNGGSAYDAARIETTTIEPKINAHKVFPNPAIHELNIETDLEGESTFQLYNVLGQKVAETTFVKKTKILVGDIGRGNHFYSIQNQGIIQDGKVLLE